MLKINMIALEPNDVARPCGSDCRASRRWKECFNSLINLHQSDRQPSFSILRFVFSDQVLIVLAHDKIVRSLDALL